MIVGTFVQVLRSWGREHNSVDGPKPPTWRRVVRITIEVTDHRWCRGCREYVDIGQFRKGKDRCKPCVNRPAAEQDEMRMHKSRWRASGQQARRRGMKLEIGWDEWLAMLIEYDFTCGEPGCNQPYTHVTHLIAPRWGGRHHRSNLRPHCEADHRAHVAALARERHINRRDVIPIERWSVTSVDSQGSAT